MENKMLVGLDISMTSTGLCIDINGFKKVYLFVDRDLTPNQYVGGVEYIKYNRVDGKTKCDMLKLVSFENLAKCVFDKIVQIMLQYNVSDEDLMIYYEKPSLSSKGAAALDIPIVNAIVRRKLLTRFKINQFRGYAPTSLKKEFCGSGRAKKEVMIEFYKSLKGLPVLEQKIKSAKIDDVVDAVALVVINQ